MNFQEFCKTYANYRVQGTDDRVGHCSTVVDLLTKKADKYIFCFRENLVLLVKLHTC